MSDMKDSDETLYETTRLFEIPYYAIAMKKVTLLIIIFIASFNVYAEDNCPSPYISMKIFEIKKNQKEVRKITRQIFLTADSYVGYRHREKVLGSKEKFVSELKFNNEYKKKASKEDVSTFVNELIGRGIIKISPENMESKSDYSLYLRFRADCHDIHINFNTKPTEGKKRAVIDAVYKFARKMKIDQPKNMEHALTVSEGDLAPALEVRLSDVLKNPKHYNGKRISVIGYFAGRFESHSFAVSDRINRNEKYRQSIWRGQFSTFADKSKLHDQNNAWQRVEGVFLAGSRGHLGLWPGEITRITLVESVESH